MSNVDKIQITYDFFDTPANLKWISDTEDRTEDVIAAIKKLAEKRGISINEATGIYWYGEFKPQEGDNK